VGGGTIPAVGNRGRRSREVVASHWAARADELSGKLRAFARSRSGNRDWLRRAELHGPPAGPAKMLRYAPRPMIPADSSVPKHNLSRGPLHLTKHGQRLPARRSGLSRPVSGNGSPAETMTPRRAGRLRTRVHNLLLAEELLRPANVSSDNCRLSGVQSPP